MKETIDLEAEVKKIWSEPNLEPIPEYLRKRGYCYCNDVLRDGVKILMFGFNPSFRNDAVEGNCSFSFLYGAMKCRNHCIYPTNKWDSYWSRISEMLANSNINHHNITAYWDLFSFREKSQEMYGKKIVSSNPHKFVVEHIMLAQRIMEAVKPKLIIVKNKEAWAYFGKFFSKDYCDVEKGWRWMNYKYSPAEDFPYEDAEVRRIVGIHTGNHPDTNVLGLSSTNLDGTKVLFMKHINQYTSKAKIPTPEAIEALLK